MGTSRGDYSDAEWAAKMIADQLEEIDLSMGAMLKCTDDPLERYATAFLPHAIAFMSVDDLLLRSDLPAEEAEAEVHRRIAQKAFRFALAMMAEEKKVRGIK